MLRPIDLTTFAALAPDVTHFYDAGVTRVHEPRGIEAYRTDLAAIGADCCRKLIAL